MLDSGGYGPVTIAQSVSIIAPAGVYAGISVLSGTGIMVNAPSGAVVLSGLTIDGLGGTIGIDFQIGDVLRLERITVSGFSSEFSSGLHASASAAIVIRDSVFAKNYWGTLITSYPSFVTLDIEHSEFSENFFGAWFGDNVKGVVSSSSFNGNVNSGAYVQPTTPVQSTTPAATAFMTFRNCVFSGNGGNGLVTGHPFLTNAVTVQITGSEFSDNGDAGIAPLFGYTTVSDSTVTRNLFGLTFSGGFSFQDNRLFANGTNGIFNGTVSKQ